MAWAGNRSHESVMVISAKVLPQGQEQVVAREMNLSESAICQSCRGWQGDRDRSHLQGPSGVETRSVRDDNGASLAFRECEL